MKFVVNPVVCRYERIPNNYYTKKKRVCFTRTRFFGTVLSLPVAGHGPRAVSARSSVAGRPHSGRFRQARKKNVRGIRTVAFHKASCAIARTVCRQLRRPSVAGSALLSVPGTLRVSRPLRCPAFGTASGPTYLSVRSGFSRLFCFYTSLSFLLRSDTASGMTFFRRRPRSFRFVLLPCFLILSCRAFRHSVRHDILSSASSGLFRSFCFRASLSFLQRSGAVPDIERMVPQGVPNVGGKYPPVIMAVQLQSSVLTAISARLLFRPRYSRPRHGSYRCACGEAKKGRRRCRAPRRFRGRASGCRSPCCILPVP